MGERRERNYKNGGSWWKASCLYPRFTKAAGKGNQHSTPGCCHGVTLANEWWKRGSLGHACPSTAKGLKILHERPMDYKRSIYYGDVLGLLKDKVG